MDYKQVIISLTSHLRRLQEIAQKIESHALADVLQVALERVQHDRFSVAVIGDFKRGKSTFINALLGAEILPADVSPATATLNRVVYAEQPAITILFRDEETRTIDVHKLANFVTKLTLESEAVAADVKEAIIYYPTSFCHQQVEIIDTPGLSDDENMTDVTLSVLQQVEMAIVVISALSPFAESETDFLVQRLLTSSIGRILFVVTRIDQLSSQDAEKILNRIQSRVQSCLQTWSEQQTDSVRKQLGLSKLGQLWIFGLSPYQALMARSENDPELLERSRFLEFETKFRQCLDQERDLITLQSRISQTIALSYELLDALNLHQQHLAQQQTGWHQTIEDLQKQVAELQQIKAKEIQHYETALTVAKAQIDEVFRQTESQLKQSAIQVIDQNEAKPSDGVQVLTQRFSRLVAEAVHSSGQTLVEKAQAAIAHLFKTQFKHLQQTVIAIKQPIQQMQQQLLALELIQSEIHDLDFNLEAQPLELPAELPVLFPNDFRLFLLWNQQKGGYTTAGAVTGGALLGPLGAAVGGAIGAGIGAHQGARKFKDNYKPKVLAAIEQQLQQQNLNQILENLLDPTLSVLSQSKQKAEQFMDETLNDFYDRLAQTQGRLQAIAEAQQATFQNSKSEVENILTNAQNSFITIVPTGNLDQLAQLNCSSCGYTNSPNAKFCIECGTRLSSA